MKLKDRTGEKVGRLTVIKQGRHYVQPNGRTRVTWECLCACGTTVLVEASNLKDTHTTSCGCLVKENCSSVGKTNLQHGMTNSREWLAWRGAKDRCFNPFTSQYINYGARHISMVHSWKDSFENFFNDMGFCPVGHSLERIDVNGNYSPTNCVWATLKQQSRNKQNTVRVHWDGGMRSLAELSEQHNLPRELVYDRVVRQFWSVKDALTKPVRIRNAKTIQTPVSL